MGDAGGKGAPSAAVRDQPRARRLRPQLRQREGLEARARAGGGRPTRSNGFHALRHHYASVLLEDGVSVRALADYLGHADPGFTLRVYTHLMPESEDRARRAVDRAWAALDGGAKAVGE